MPRALGNSIKLGLVDATGQPLVMTPEQRATHTYICGSTGTGKSKMLEYLIRQDIANWPKSKCGLVVLDPHGSLYDGLMNWLTWHAPKHLKKVPIVPIDLRQTDWTVAYNVMRARAKADPAVIINNFVQAMDVLILDELGYVPFSKTGAELLFDVVSRAYERTSLIVTTNLPFEQWTEVLGSERLTGALLDRLTHRVHILEANGQSYRLTDAKRRLKRK